MAGVPLGMVKSNYETIISKLPGGIQDYGALLARTAAGGCSSQEAKEAQDFFGPRMSKVNGGPRALAQVVEGIDLCEARKNVQQAYLKQFFQTFRSARCWTTYHQRSRIEELSIGTLVVNKLIARDQSWQ